MASIKNKANLRTMLLISVILGRVFGLPIIDYLPILYDKIFLCSGSDPFSVFGLFSYVRYMLPMVSHHLSFKTVILCAS